MAKTTPIRMLLSLTLITLFSGGLLGYVYEQTKEPIRTAAIRQKEEAIRLVAPAFDNSPVTEATRVKVGGKEMVVYPALKGGKWQGAAVESLTGKGFGDTIRIMVGFEADGTIRNYKVLKHTETPGLGSKMEEWFRSEKNRRSIIGKHPRKDKLTVTKDGGQVDAITAATITSRAFLEAVQQAYSAFAGNADGVSSASQQTGKENKR